LQSLLKDYLIQEHQTGSWLNVNSDSYQYFKNFAHQGKKSPSAPHQILPAQTPIAAPVKSHVPDNKQKAEVLLEQPAKYLTQTPPDQKKEAPIPQKPIEELLQDQPLKLNPMGPAQE